MTDADLAVVLQSASRTELDLAQNLLEQAGIPCSIREHAGLPSLWASYGLAPTAPGSLLVAHERLLEARDILRRAWGPRASERHAE
jgi:Putative prokaryotic signal transducing protein